MGKRWFAPATLIAMALLLVGGFMVGGRLTVAQDTAATPPSMMDQAHPAHIHEGTCDALGGVVFPLNDVTATDMHATPMPGLDGTPMPVMEGTPVGDDMATPMPGMEQAQAQSTTTIEVELDTILAGTHAINVHESMENIQNYIACGDITGTPTNGELEVELMELNDSGYEGRATLMDNQDGTTTVTIMLWHRDAGVMATPVQ